MRPPATCRAVAFTLALTAVTATGAAPAASAAAATVDCQAPIYQSPARQVVCAAGAAVDVGQIAADLGRRFDLAAAPATALARTTLHAVDLAKRQAADLPAPALSELREVEDGYVESLRQTAADAHVIDELQRFAADWDWGVLREPSPALTAYITRSADSAGLALKLTRSYPGQDTYSLALLLAAAAARPAPAALWLRAADVSASWPALRLAFLEQAAGAAGSEDEGIAVAERRLRELLGAGLAREALGLFDGLPSIVRERVLAAQGSSLAVLRQESDLRLELAVARGLTGDRADGRALLARVPAATAEARDPAPGAGAAGLDARIVARRLAEAELADGSRQDLFPLLAAAVARREMALPYQTDHAAFARLAEREGYPAFAAFILPAEPPWEEPSLREPTVLPRGPSRAAARLRARLTEEIRHEMDAQAAARAAIRTGLGPDPAAGSVARLLAAPPPAFRERRLPPSLSRIAPASTGAGELARALHLPDGSALVRIERAGRRAAAIVETSDSGPGSGYSVALSADGGATWSRRFGTGLRNAQPYIVRPASSLPLFAGDQLQVEVERVPENGPMLLPSMQRIGPGVPGFYLEIPLAELTRDRDRDGATDLEEEWQLLTDPEDPDTDGDGLRDGADPLPLVAAAPVGPASAAMAAFLDRIGERSEPQAAVTGASVQPAPLLPAEPLYVVADRPLFTGLAARRRIVVLAPEEVDAAEKRLGPLCLRDIPLFALDRERRHAVAVWSWCGQGGTVWLEEKDGVWTATELGYWIS
jgi:hypothetical protein